MESVTYQDYKYTLFNQKTIIFPKLIPKKNSRKTASLIVSKKKINYVVVNQSVEGPTGVFK